MKTRETFSQRAQRIGNPGMPADEWRQYLSECASIDALETFYGYGAQRRRISSILRECTRAVSRLVKAAWGHLRP